MQPARNVIAGVHCAVRPAISSAAVARSPVCRLFKQCSIINKCNYSVHLSSVQDIARDLNEAQRSALLYRAHIRVNR